MSTKNQNHLYLALWIIALIGMGMAIGSLTREEISGWYSVLNRSTLTPPNYVFPIAWTTLYAMIAISGWMIWSASSFKNLALIKKLFVMQLILNWSWSPVFFTYHLTGLSLLIIALMVVLVATIIYLSYPKLKKVSLLMLPYLAWICFASYLNFYIWKFN